jgi:tRNA pseudouridine13 synthase
MCNKDIIIDVTADNIAQFTIYDVVLPVVGYSIRFPENEMKDMIMEILKEDNISMDNFTEMSKVSGISCHGAYRKILAIPEDLNFDIIEM